MNSALLLTELRALQTETEIGRIEPIDFLPVLIFAKTVAYENGRNSLKADTAWQTGPMNDRRRRRALASGERAGRYSRDQAWKQVKDFARHSWWLLILIPVVFFVASIPLMLKFEGIARGAVLGASVASGLWFDAWVAVVWTGASSKFMGVNGELWTAEEIRRLDGRGWRLINGLQLNDRHDIDHAAVGPGGVLVVESKWSASAWPLNGPGPKFMEGQLAKAASQVQRNAKEVADYLSTVPGIPVTAIAVFWSGTRSEGVGWQTWGDGRTVLMHGPDFRRWLRDELPDIGASAESVEHAYALLAAKAEDQDRVHADAGEIATPTLKSLTTEWVIKPIVGMFAAAYLLSIDRFVRSWIVDLVVACVVVVAGIYAYRFKIIQRIAVGWIAVSIPILILEVGIVIRSALH